MPVLTVEKPLRDSLGNDAAVDSLIRLQGVGYESYPY